MSRRSFRDIAALQASNFPCIVKEQCSTSSGISFETLLNGPSNTPYAKGQFKISFHLPETFPFASPSVGFATKIYHPNIDERSGSVCLDVIGSNWTPMYTLLNVMELLLPQLLDSPNPLSPLNGEAAALYLRSKSEFNAYVEHHVIIHSLKTTNVVIDSTSLDSIPLDSTPIIPDVSNNFASEQLFSEEIDSFSSSILSNLSELSLL